MNYSETLVAIVIGIVGIVRPLLRSFMPAAEKSASWLLAILVGIALTAAVQYAPDVWNTVLQPGIVVGLIASGLYSGVKTIARVRIQQAIDADAVNFYDGEIDPVAPKPAQPTDAPRAPPAGTSTHL